MELKVLQSYLQLMKKLNVKPTIDAVKVYANGVKKGIIKLWNLY
ncbi:MAG: hypothetical protein ACRCUM_04220 [Mycoplasmoidaceae bacterium]